MINYFCGACKQENEIFLPAETSTGQGKHVFCAWCGTMHYALKLSSGEINVTYFPLGTKKSVLKEST